MALGDTLWFGLAALDQWNTTAANRIDYLTDTIKCSLHSSTYAPAQDTHDFWDDATNELAATGGYTTGGVTLAGKTLTYDGPSNTVRFKCNDITWVALTQSAAIKWGVYYKSTGTASTSHLMGYVDCNGATPGGTDFTIRGNATDGILRAVVA
jgi:hypothetical protein